MKKVKIAKAAGQIMFITIISKILGFLRDAVTASNFGATYQTDAYNMAISIPNIVYGLFGMAITTTFIPILSESLKKNGKKDMFEFANSVMNIITLISIVLTVLGWIFAPQLVRIIAPKFTGEKYELTVSLTKLSVINILFLSVNSGCMGILQTLDEFIGPSLVGVALNIPIIVYLMICKNNTIEGLTIATLMGGGAQIVVQLPWIIKNRCKFSAKINLKDTRLKKMLILISPVLLGIGINQINTFVDNIVASGLVDGTVSSLQYANRINSIVYSVFAASIVTVIYPALSKSMDEDNLVQFKKYINTSTNNINLIMIPSTVGIMVLRVTIINVLFKRGAFDDAAVVLTSDALLFLGVGMAFLGIRDVYNRAFYSLQDTKTPMINGAFGVLTNVILDIILAKYIGIKGLTIATTSSIIVCTVLLIVSLSKKIGSIQEAQTIKNIFKIITASLIMGIGVYFSDKYFTNILHGFKGSFVSLTISTVLGILIYTAIIEVLNVEEYKELRKKIMSRFVKFK